MEDFLFHPATWSVIGGILLVVVVVAIVVSKKRSREVEELDNLFPEGSLSGENLEKIPVEKVRRSTLERDRKKREREQQIPQKIRPKKGSKVFAEEDQEFILTNIRKNTQQHQVLKPRKQNANAYDEDSSQAFNDSSSSNAKWSNTHQQTPSTFNRKRNQQEAEDKGSSVSESNYTDSYSSTSAPFSRSKKSYGTQTSSRSMRSNLSRSSRISQQNTTYHESSDTMKTSTRSRATKYAGKKKFF